MKMKMSFNMKLNVLFLGLMVIFMAISSLISYQVSQSLIIDNMKLSNESELSINLETMENSTYKSKEKFQLFIDDYNLSFDGTAEDNNTLLSNASDFNSELRTFLYTNKEFKGIFLYQNNILIGTSLTNEIISSVGSLDERSASQTLYQYLLAQLKEHWRDGQGDWLEENLLIELIKEGTYIIAVLDYQKLLEQSDLSLVKINKANQVIYGEEPKVQEFLKSNHTESLDSGIIVTSRFDNQIVSVKNKNGDKYILLRDISQVARSFSEIVWKLVVYGSVIFIIFAVISRFKTKGILNPVYDFFQKLKQIKGFEEHQSIDSYISTYKGHSSVNKKLFMYFSMLIIPTICMTLISFYYFNRIIEENSRQNHIHIFKQTAKGIENKLQAYHSYMRYLSLNGEFQELMLKINGDASQWNQQFSDILVRKGIINKNLSYISIYNAYNQLVFSNTKNKLAVTSSQPMMVMKKEIKYLGNSVDKSSIFKYMGYIEFGINESFSNQQSMNSKSAVILMNQNADGQVQMISSPMDQPYAEYMNKHLPSMKNDSAEYKYLTVNGEKTLFSFIPIDQGEWGAGLFAKTSWEEQRYIFILLYAIEIFCMLWIIIIVSTLLGKRMTAPIRRAIHLMEAYPGDQSIRFHGAEHDFEFVILAKNFNHMLSRLEAMSMELKTKENENFEMEQRINKLLFKALQSQINPHFLQNIFTSIMLLLKTEKTQKATEMLVATAKFLKTGLSGSRELITLEEELEHVNNYIKIQSIRFEKELAFKIEVDEMYVKTQIPKFILQPIVENAIHHAMVKNQLLTIRVSSQRENDDLIIIVEDDGKGMDQTQLRIAINNMNDKSQSIHCGLSNVHERISLEFGEAYGLEIESASGEGTRIKLKIILQSERLIG
jgi:sensor histidine kinase YesM